MKIRPLLLASACLAFPALIVPEAAFAQAFAGGATVTAGAAVRDVTTGTTETITVFSPSAIIDWKPEDVLGLGPVDFLPAGNVAIFQNGPNNPDFAVLNRIIPGNLTRPIALNGTVISQLQTAGGETIRGGTVAFYSPGGIIIGPTAVFDIGNLLLTTIDPIADLATGEFFIGNSYNLSGAVDPKSFVRIQAGAKINATAERSYVAVASPVIEQMGAIRVNGSTGLVAAEQLTMTIDQGLFDIQVKVGSSSAPATIVHQGSTGGPGSGAADDNHKIYMVAVPKDAAISLLLRGQVGYDAAAVAGVENGEIILSAGYNVNRFAEGVTQAGPVDARIDIRQANASSDLTGIATTSAVATAFGGEALTFQQDVTLISRDANLGSEGGALTVGGDALVTSGREIGFEFGLGGTSSIFARGGGSVSIAGDAIVSASASARPGGFAIGGSAAIAANNGTISIGGDARVEADAFGSRDLAQDPGEARGGNAFLLAINGGKVDVAGSAVFTARGEGGTSDGAGDGIPGPGKGGMAGATINGAGSELRVGGDLTLDASAVGGMARTGAIGASEGVGGEARMTVGDSGLVRVAGATSIEANGRGGTGVESAPLPNIAGAMGTGGTASVTVNNGDARFDSIRLGAVGAGGDATGNAANGGSGNGGLTRIQMFNNAVLQARDYLLEARGVGGLGPTPGTGSGGTVSAIGSGAGIAGDRFRADAGANATLANVRMNTSITARAEADLIIEQDPGFIGLVTAPAISLASRDIDIKTGVTLGGPATTSIRLDVIAPTAQTVIGGTPAAAGPGYTLDADEISRLRSDSVSIFAPAVSAVAGRPPDVVVDDFALLDSISVNPFAFTLETPGRMTVVGDVRLLGAAAGDTMSLRADERFEVYTPGSIYLLDGAGNPGGRLTIESSNIVVAEAGLAAQLAADPNFAGRNAALLTNTGPFHATGYLQAGGITFRIGTAAPGATLFIQNSGPLDDPRGLTVGAAGLTIAPQQNRAATVVGFGRRRNDDGSFTTGDAFFATVNYDRTNGTFTDESEINLCKVNSGICPSTPEPPGVDPRTLIPVSLPGSENVLGPLLPERDEAMSSAPLIDAGSLNAAPLIEEPVASGGDSSLWTGDEDEEDRDDDSRPD